MIGADNEYNEMMVNSRHSSFQTTAVSINLRSGVPDSIVNQSLDITKIAREIWFGHYSNLGLLLSIFISLLFLSMGLEPTMVVKFIETLQPSWADFGAPKIGAPKVSNK